MYFVSSNILILAYSCCLMFGTLRYVALHETSEVDKNFSYHLLEDTVENSPRIEEERPEQLKVGPLVDDEEYDDYVDYDIDTIIRHSKKVLGSREDDYSKEDNELWVKLHNILKNNMSVDTFSGDKYLGKIPYSSNSEYYEWDNVLAWQAEEWSDMCVWIAHGRPESVNSSYTQNLYYGPNPSPRRISFLWYREYMFYNFTNMKCNIKVEKDGTTCGHYTCLVWGESNRVGCAKKYCRARSNLLVTCHNSPEGNFYKTPPFKIGKPCTDISPESDQKLCYGNLGVSERQCRDYKLEGCRCNLDNDTCRNCADIDQEKCECICRDGWDGKNCDMPCANKNKQCDKMSLSYCSSGASKIRNRICRKRCGTCKTLDPAKQYALCCHGIICPEGYSINKTDCTCVVNCPGTLCPYETTLAPHTATAVNLDVLSEFTTPSDDDEQSTESKYTTTPKRSKDTIPKSKPTTPKSKPTTSKSSSLILSWIVLLLLVLNFTVF